MTLNLAPIVLALAVMWLFVVKRSVTPLRVAVATLASVLSLAIALSWSVLSPLAAHIAFQVHLGG